MNVCLFLKTFFSFFFFFGGWWGGGGGAIFMNLDFILDPKNANKIKQ